MYLSIQLANSKLFSYGSNFLAKLHFLNSDIEVYEKQRWDRQSDIINNQPREYKDTIKIFPKIRFENYDNTYWRRRSFIEGNPEYALIHYQGDSKTVTNRSNLYRQMSSNNE